MVYLKTGKDAEMYRELYEVQKKQGKAVRAVGLKGPLAGKSCVFAGGNFQTYGGDGDEFLPYKDKVSKICKTEVIDWGENTVFTEVFLSQPHLVILGGGHVSVPTARIGKMLGFFVTVMDDREEFLSKERFPDADQLVFGEFEEISKKIPVYENTYYVVVTRGHMGDAACAREILRRPYAYLGMIGSRAKAANTKGRLIEEGFSKELVDSIHCPIGLPIGGSLPEEVAVSIMAQIVEEKNRHYSAYCDQDILERVCSGAKGVMATIISKEGSSPRGVGSKMFVEEDGRTTGSIGGGREEYEAICHCKNVQGQEVQKYKLYTTKEAANLGMICGGTNEILFERV